MKRKDAINHIKFAGYHGDNARATRLYIENRISIAVVKAAYREGAQCKANGMKCTCYDCTNSQAIRTLVDKEQTK